MTAKIRSPKNDMEFVQRNKLLQSTMRLPTDQLPIELEYPTVLARENATFSLCAFAGSDVVAHLNYWPRKLLLSNGNTLAVALIGNVASREDARGKGYIQALFDAATDRAKQEGIHVLYLWSDLHQFYQKLNFRSVATEFRFRFSQENLAAFPTKDHLQVCDVKHMTSQDLQCLLDQRPKTAGTLARSIDEFKTLLTIPETYIFRTSSKPDSGHLITGKGADMQGVVHEWGVSSPESLLQGLATLVRQYHLTEIVLLAPSDLNPTWIEHFMACGAIKEIHPMAHAKIIKDAPGLAAAIDQSFIWGLDSI